MKRGVIVLRKLRGQKVFFTTIFDKTSAGSNPISYVKKHQNNASFKKKTFSYFSYKLSLRNTSTLPEALIMLCLFFYLFKQQNYLKLKI